MDLSGLTHSLPSANPLCCLLVNRNHIQLLTVLYQRLATKSIVHNNFSINILYHHFLFIAILLYFYTYLLLYDDTIPTLTRPSPARTPREGDKKRASPMRCSFTDIRQVNFWFLLIFDHTEVLKCFLNHLFFILRHLRLPTIFTSWSVIAITHL